MARVIVAGPPCAGKSTYVKERTEPGDVVWDYDTAHQALSGQPSHAHSDRVRPYVIKARDAVLDLLGANKTHNAWVITSSSKAAEIDRLKDLLGAEVVLMDVDQVEAHARADRDKRPAEWHGYIDRWFAESDINTAKGPAKAWTKARPGGNMEIKTYTGRMALKADQPGAFEAVFATLNVKDLDGDVTAPGAFENGQAVRIAAWGHDWDSLPVGRGEIAEVENEAIVRGRFFTDTTAGREHYETIKGLGDLQEWSYGFEVLEAEPGEVDGEKVRILKSLRVVEVSPVMLGAGIGTRTTAIKAGARHSAKDNEAIQTIHDLIVQLGAKCKTDDDTAGGEGDGEGEGETSNGKPSGPSPRTLAARLAVELEQESYNE